MAAKFSKSVSPRARGVYDAAIVADNTIPWGGHGAAGFDMALRDALPEKLRKAGVTFAALTIAEDNVSTSEAIALLGAEYRYWRARSDTCRVVHTAEDIRRAKAEAAMEGRTLRAFVMDAVVHELDRAAGVTAPRQRVNLPLVRSRHPGSLRITGETVAAALAAEDLHVLA